MDDLWHISAPGPHRRTYHDFGLNLCLLLPILGPAVALDGLGRCRSTTDGIGACRREAMILHQCNPVR
ncbi:MAG TPA: hypothetical protein VLK82_21225 [Candidatus Tectomicrobia bacterium]|nr:hypothetical protein [Candidatus Tectomicrobia bacterium]